MSPPAYRQNDFEATHALGHMVYGYTLLVPMNQRVLSKLSKEYKQDEHNNIYVFMITYIMLILLL